MFSNNSPRSKSLISHSQDPDLAIQSKRPRSSRIYADESGFHDAKYYAFGALVMPHDRRGDFTKAMREMRELHGFDRELKYSRTAPGNLAFAKNVVKYFFERPWLGFQCMLVKNTVVDMTFHKDREEARKKHHTMFFRKLVQRLNRGVTDRGFHIIIDKSPYGYRKWTEAARTIANYQLRNDIGEDLIESLTAHESHEVEGIQVCDLLLGATLSAWQGEATAPAKDAIMREVASYLGWEDTLSDTRPSELKFNIWHFQDRLAPRVIATRKVNLRIPWPAARER